MFVYHFPNHQISNYILLTVLARKCQIMLEQWTTPKISVVQRQQRFILHSAAYPLKLICATAISMSTREFPSACFHDWLGRQDWKVWQITGWLLEHLFKASAQEWVHWQIGCMFMPKYKEKMQSYDFLEGRKLGNTMHYVGYANDYHTDSITGTKLISIDYCLPNWNYKRLGNVPT